MYLSAGPTEVGMSIDTELARHQATWHGFTRLVQAVTVGVIVVVIVLAFITL